MCHSCCPTADSDLEGDTDFQKGEPPSWLWPGRWNCLPEGKPPSWLWPSWVHPFSVNRASSSREPPWLPSFLFHVNVHLWAGLILWKTLSKGNMTTIYISLILAMPAVTSLHSSHSSAFHTSFYLLVLNHLFCLNNFLFISIHFIYFMLIEITKLNGAVDKDSTYKPIWETDVISEKNKLLTSRWCSLADIRGFKTIFRNLWGPEICTSLTYTFWQLGLSLRLLILSGSFWGCTIKW